MPSFWQAWVIVGLLLNLWGLSGDVTRAFAEAEKGLSFTPPYWFRMLCAVTMVIILTIAWPVPVFLSGLFLLSNLGRGK